MFLIYMVDIKRIMFL